MYLFYPPAAAAGHPHSSAAKRLLHQQQHQEQHRHHHHHHQQQQQRKHGKSIPLVDRMEKLFFWLLLLSIFAIPVYFVTENNEIQPPHEDGRCRCVCPNPAVLNISAVNFPFSERKIYIQSVLPEDCECPMVVLPQLMAHPKYYEQLKDKFCPRCLCRYETRNTTVIKIVVILVIWIVVILTIYMGFLFFLDPLLRRFPNTDEITDEGENEFSKTPPVAASRRPSLIFHRIVGHQQIKWQKTVREQRKHIYDRRTMLN